MQRAALRDVIVCCICREVGFRGHALFDKKERLHLTMRQRLRAHKFQTLHLGSIVQTGLLHLPPEEFATPGGSITPTSSQPWLEAHIDHAGLSLALELRPIANWIEVCEVAGSICSCCPIPGYLTADVADVARQCGCRYFRWRQTFQQWQGPAWFPSRHKMQRERLQVGPTTT